MDDADELDEKEDEDLPEDKQHELIDQDSSEPFEPAKSKKSTSRKKDTTGMIVDPRVNAVLNLNPAIEAYKYDDSDSLWCEVRREYSYVKNGRQY